MHYKLIALYIKTELITESSNFCNVFVNHKSAENSKPKCFLAFFLSIKPRYKYIKNSTIYFKNIVLILYQINF